MGQIIEAVRESGLILEPIVGVVIGIALYLMQSWLAILVHESGHAAAAKLTGRRIHLFAVWPFVYRPRAKQWFPFAGMQGQDFGGFVIATPSRPGDWHKGEAFFILGGALGNILTSALAFLAIATGLFGGAFNLALSALAVSSFTIALINLVPRSVTGGARTDGAHLLDMLLRRRDPALERAGWLSGREIDGVRTAELDPSLLRELEADISSGKAPEISYRFFYNHFLARSDVRRCLEILDLFVSRPEELSDWVRIERAFLIALLHKEGDEALQLLAAVSPAARSNYGYWRALAVARHAAEDRQGAIDAARHGREVVKNSRAELNDDDLALLAAIERGAERLPLSDTPVPA